MTIAKDTDRDRFMSADEAKTYGLVDQVVQLPQGDSRSGRETGHAGTSPLTIGRSA